MSNVKTFETILSDQYRHLYAAKPSEYSLAMKRFTPEQLAQQMTRALADGAANKDGEGIANTCKALGIKPTYKAIRAYLCEVQS